MKTVILGSTLASLLVAGSASAQAIGSMPSHQWVPAPPPPATFALRDTTVDIETSIGPRSWRLGAFTLLRRETSDVTLRFTLMGVPPPAILAPAPRGQALATVRVDVIALARR